MATSAPPPPLVDADLDLTIRQVLAAHAPDMLNGQPVSIVTITKALKAIAWKRRGWKP